MTAVATSAVQAAVKPLHFAQMKQTCGLHLTSRLKRVEFAIRDLHSKPTEMAFAFDGSFRSDRVLSCYKRVMRQQRPQPVKMGRVSGLVVTLASGRSAVILRVGPHKIVWADPVAAAWAASGDLWMVSPSLAALRRAIPRRAVFWLAMGRLPFNSGKWKTPALQGVTGIDALVASILPGRRRTSRVRWTMGGTIRLATQQEASKFLTVLTMAQRALAVASKGGAASPGNAVKNLFALTVLSQSGRDLRMTASFPESLVRVMIRTLLAKLSFYP